MTVLLEFKQSIKIFYGKHDTFILPILKFLLALITFCGINSSLGFMKKLNSIFILLILSIVCSILPMNAIVVIGFLLIVGHCYAVSIEVAGFAILLMILLMILFLRFASKDTLALILTPVAFGLNVPAVLPIGAGLLRGFVSALPASCGVILYHFMTLVKEKETVLKGTETKAPQKLKLLLDGILKDQTMWLTVLAFIAVVLAVSVIRKMSADYAWHIAIVVGGLVYIVTMVAGGFFLDVKSTWGSMVISTIASCGIALVLEFFVLGVDYTRSEMLQYEDDEYVYYVKAVPKALITQAKRSIKTIEETLSEYELEEGMHVYQDRGEEAPVERVSFEDVNFEEKLEDSLKNL